MDGSFTYRHPVTAPDDFSFEVTSGDERSHDKYHGDANKRSKTTVSTENSSDCSQEPSRYDHRHRHDQVKAPSRNPALHAALYQGESSRHILPQHGELSDGHCQIQDGQHLWRGDIDPTLLASTGTPFDHSYGPCRLYDPYLKIGGQFETLAGSSEQTYNPQGRRTIAESTHHAVHDGSGAEQTFDPLDETWVPAGRYVGHDSGLSEAQNEQQSILKTSLGRMPGHKAGLARVVEQVPQAPPHYSRQGHGGPVLSIDPAFNDNCATIGPQMFDMSPSFPQPSTGYADGVANSILPNILVSNLEHMDQTAFRIQSELTSNEQSQPMTDPHRRQHGRSTTTSIMSFNAIRCPECQAKFTGRWKKGNLRRHTRLGCTNGRRLYKCKAAGCKSSFRRQDARLKHYRKSHPYLAPNPVVQRKSSTSTGGGSGWEQLRGSNRSYNQASPRDSQGIDDSSSSVDCDEYYQDGSSFG